VSGLPFPPPRKPGDKIALTRSEVGTDVDFGALTKEIGKAEGRGKGGTVTLPPSLSP